MTNQLDSDAAIELERYELAESPAYLFEVDRREFFKLFGCGVLVGLALKRGAAQESGGGRRGGRNSMPQDISAWLHIGEDGGITVFTGKVELGQDIRTSLTQAVAEELSAPISSIKLVMGDTDLTPFDIGTFGSRTTPGMAPQLHRAAAAAREMLLDLAAAQMSLDRPQLTVTDGKIVDKSGKKSVSFGALTKGQKLVKTIPAEITVTPAREWKTAGKPVAKVNARELVTGKHRYPSDVKRPGMLYGKVLRAPAFGASLGSVDTSGAERVKGATVVRDGDFVGVAGITEQAASRGLSEIKAEWKTTPQISQSELFQHFTRKTDASGERSSRFTQGSVKDQMSSAEIKLEASYTVAYIAHSPLEPRAAVAEWASDKLTVWTGTQRPFGVRGELAQAFRIPEERVRVIVPDTGSGYGGKHTGECAIEAARLAKASGKPVRVVWTREEEFTWAYFRPAGVINVSSATQKDGRITAWEFHNFNSGGSAIRTPYDIANQIIEFHPADSPLRQGSYRGLAASANHFARESHMDEIARRAGIDPLELRLKNLKDARLRAVFEAGAQKFGWGKQKRSQGRGFGMGGGTEKGSYTATFAEVEVDRSTGSVKILRAVTAFECGAVVNPDHLKDQVEGALIMGIGGALFESIDFGGGKILNPRFSRYRVPRFSDVPVMETVLLDRKDLPSVGAGETPIVGMAPAVANALFDAAGIRVRSLPLAPNGIKDAGK